MSYWTKQFNVSPEQLRAAVERAGGMVRDVKRELGELQRRAAAGLSSAMPRRPFVARG